MLAIKIRARLRVAAALAAAALATALGALAAAGATTARAQSGPTHPVLFVANSVAGTVTLIDARTFRVLGTLNIIPDGSTPRDPAQAAVYPSIVSREGVNYAQGIAVSPDGQTLYVSRGYLGDVAAFRMATGQELWRLQINGVRADHIALSPDGRRLFVSALTANMVQVIDTQTHTFVGQFLTGDWPHVLEFSPDAKLIYNGSLGNQLLPSGLDGRKQLTVADPQTLQVVSTYQFNAGVRPFVITPDGDTAYIQLSYLPGFVEFDLRTGQIVKTVKLPVSGPGAQMQPSQYPNQAAHHGIALSDDGAYICDAGTISNYVALVSRPALTVAAIIPVGDQPAEALTSLDGRYCFVTNRGPGSEANTVSVISYSERREIARIPTGEHPMEEEEAMVPESVVRSAPNLPSPGSATARGPAPGTGPCTPSRVVTLRYRHRRPRPRSIIVRVAGRRVRRVHTRSSVRVDLRGRRGVVRVVLVGRARGRGRIVRHREVHTFRLCG